MAGAGDDRSGATGDTHLPSSSFDTLRLQMARTARIDDEGSLASALELALRASARALGVARVSVWMFESGRGRLVPSLVVKMGEDAGGEEEEPLVVAHHAGYFQSLEMARTMTARDALRDPRTAALASYFEERGIGATMDAGIFRHGKIVGVVCHEHLGGPREFTAQERMLAGSMADLVALLMEQADRAQAETALREAEGQLRVAERSRELAELAGVITHDFNNLLTIIGAQTTLALRPERTEVQRLAGLGEIRAATDRASKLARQLLAFGRRLSLDVREVDLAGLVRDTGAMLATLAGDEHPVGLEIPAERIEVRCDGAEVERVLMNLVANARDSMPAGGPVEVRVHRRAGPDGPEALVEVTDRGAGMDEATRAKIFDPYFTTKVGGTGLGLAAAQGIVTACGGHIEVASGVGLGSTFRLVFPALVGDPT